MVKNCRWKKWGDIKNEVKSRTVRRKMYSLRKWFKIILVQSRIKWIRNKLMALAMRVSRKNYKRLRRNYLKIKIMGIRKKRSST